MRYVFSVVLTLAWGLWFGGQATLVLLIMTLFMKDRPIAVRAGPYMFHTFERYQLVLAIITLVSALALWTISRRRAFAIMLGCFFLAGMGGLISMTTVTRQMEQLWRDNQADSPAFAKLHQKSRTLYNTEFLLLIIAGCTLPRALRVTSPETVSASAPVTTPPA